MSRDDLEALRVPLIVLAATVLLSGTMIYISSVVRGSAEQLLAQRENALREARTRIQNAGEEKEMIARYLVSYQQLARAGFVGDEQRIDWLDGLRVANEQTGVFGVEYEISAQRPYAYAAEFGTGRLSLQESLMRLKFRLLHEEDLSRFLNVLSRASGGYFTVDQCVIRRLKPIDSDKRLQVDGNLGAECELRWLTVKPTSSPTGKQG